MMQLKRFLIRNSLKWVIIVSLLTYAEANPDAKRLYDDLLSNYNRLIRPVSNNTDTVLVKLGLRLSQLIDLVSTMSQSFINPSRICPLRTPTHYNNKNEANPFRDFLNAKTMSHVRAIKKRDHAEPFHYVVDIINLSCFITFDNRTSSFFATWKL